MSSNGDGWGIFSFFFFAISRVISCLWVVAAGGASPPIYPRQAVVPQKHFWASLLKYIDKSYEHVLRQKTIPNHMFFLPISLESVIKRQLFTSFNIGNRKESDPKSTIDRPLKQDTALGTTGKQKRTEKLPSASRSLVGSCDWWIVKCFPSALHR